MTSALRILQDLTTGYSIFEKDQVLTESQLNSITDYLNDQNRLHSIYLLGVGIVSGLRVSLANPDAIATTKITVTKGVGITTDGDLLYYSNDTICDRYVQYDKSYPKYDPFYLSSEGGEEEMISVYELIPEGTTDSRSPTSLSEFSTQTSKDLNNMIAVLLMESYVNDPDLCTGTDCDNLGKDCRNTPRLLLVEKNAINLLLKPAIATPDQAFRNLNEVVAERPLISSSIASVSALVNVYQNVCSNIYNNLVAELAKIYPNCAFFLTDVFTADPTERWKKILNDSTANNLGFQYYYDFLKDVVETYNQFRDLLFVDNTWCCPDTNWFPKHLLLGNLVLDSDPEENRTAFYPSPAISQTTESLNHAKFLIRKLDKLIDTFQIPAISDATDSIRITPSLFEEKSLEERAIPYYYQANPIHKSWNYHLSQRRMDNRNYSYNAPNYGAQGAALNPLSAQIGKFSFFRIEGHLGQNVETAISSIEEKIKAKNLPFAVRSVLLGEDKSSVVKRPGIRYSDLHRFHYLLRQDAYHQLNEVTRFSGNFSSEIDRMADSVVERSQDVAGIKAIAIAKDSFLKNKVSLVQKKLNTNYLTHISEANASWKNDISDVLTTTGEFKRNLGDFVKTEFTTPFDSIISNSHIQWIDWLAQIIKNKDDKEDEKLLFSKFISQHPSLEHFAGVTRGGTFVLVYNNDENKTVVADFMLPYYCEDKSEETPEEPVLEKPTIRPDTIIDQGIRVIPSFDRRFVNFRSVIEPEFTKKFDIQQKYFDIYKGFVDTSTGIFSKMDQGKLPKIDVTRYANQALDLNMQESENRRQMVEILKQQAIQPSLSDDSRRLVNERINQAENDLATSLHKTTELIATSGTDPAATSEGLRAIQEVSQHMEALTQGSVALNTLQTRLTNTSVQTNNPALKAMIGNIAGNMRLG